MSEVHRYWYEAATQTAEAQAVVQAWLEAK